MLNTHTHIPTMLKATPLPAHKTEKLSSHLLKTLIHKCLGKTLHHTITLYSHTSKDEASEIEIKTHPV